MALPTNVIQGNAAHVTHHNTIHALMPTGESVVVKSKAGVPVDGDFTSTPGNGTLAVNTSTNHLYTRIAGAWVDVTASFDTAQVPFKNAANTFTAEQTFDTNTKNKGPRPWLDVRAYGAVGNGIADDTVAINATITAAAAAAQFGNSGIHGSSSIYSGTSPVVYFPPGVYKITASLPVQSVYLQFFGNRAQIVAGDAVDVFTGVGYSNMFHGLTFRHGRHIISIATTNLDTTIIPITNCEFVEYQGNAIQDDRASNSTHLTVERCKFMCLVAGARVISQGLDIASFRDCWISNNHTEAFLVDAGTLYLEKVTMVPQEPTSGRRWITMGTGSVHIAVEDSRFGGEFGGRQIVRCSAPPDTSYPVIPSSLVIKNCDVYTPDTTYPFEFLDIPNVVEITGNLGFVNSNGIYFNNPPGASMRALGGHESRFIVENNEAPIPVATHDSTPGNFPQSQAIVAKQVGVTGAIGDVSEVARQIETNNTTGFGASISSTGMSVSDIAGASVMGRSLRQYQATAAYANFMHSYTTALSGLTAWSYTFIVEVTTSQAFNLHVKASNKHKRIDLIAGSHVICLPFNYEPAQSSGTSLELAGYVIKSGTVIQIAGFRVVQGIMNTATPHTVVYHGAAPTTGDWARGDIVWNSSPGAAGVIGWVCTLSGTPGTWKSFGAIAA